MPHYHMFHSVASINRGISEMHLQRIGTFKHRTQAVRERTKLMEAGGGAIEYPPEAITNPYPIFLCWWDDNCGPEHFQGGQ